MKQRNLLGKVLALGALALVGAGCATQGWEAEETDWKKDELAGRVRSVKEVHHMHEGHADGSSTLEPAAETLTEYDADGYTVRTASQTFRWPSEDAGATTYSRGRGGRNVASAFTSADGEREVRVERQYDEAGRLLTIHEHENGQEIANAAYTYDAQGRMVAYEAWDGEHVRFTYSYNAQGQQARKETWREGALVEYTLLEHDAQGNCTERRDYNPDTDMLVMRQVYRYDDQRRDVEYVQYDADNQERRRVSISYNEHGHRASLKVYHQGSLVSSCAYDYEYDAQGNWTKRDAVDLGQEGERLGVSERTVRELAYY